MVDDVVAPTVLLIEYHEDCRSLWRMLLDGDERFGHVSEAGSSREAFDLLCRDYFDLIIADLRSGGLDILDMLRSRRPMPIVIATSAGTGVAHVAMKHGATDFWPKVESVSPEMSQRLWNLWRQSASADAPSGSPRFAVDP